MFLAYFPYGSPAQTSADWCLAPAAPPWPGVRAGSAADQVYWPLVGPTSGVLVAGGPVFSRWPAEDILVQTLRAAGRRADWLRLYVSPELRSVHPPRPEKPYHRSVWLTVSPAITPHLRLELFAEDHIGVEAELTGMQDLRFLDDWEIILHSGAYMDVNWAGSSSPFEAGWQFRCDDAPGCAPRLLVWDDISNGHRPADGSGISSAVRKFLRCVRCVA